jgi:hypothetical protein
MDLIKEYAVAILALFAAGGTGTLIVKHFLGSAEGPKIGNSNHANAESSGTAIVQTGGGNIDICHNMNPTLKREDLRHRYQLPRYVTAKIVGKLKKKGCDDATIEKHFDEFARNFHWTAQRIEYLKEGQKKEEPQLSEAHAVLNEGDIELATKLCDEVESDRRSSRLAGPGER